MENDDDTFMENEMSKDSNTKKRGSSSGKRNSSGPKRDSSGNTKKVGSRKWLDKKLKAKPTIDDKDSDFDSA